MSGSTVLLRWCLGTSRQENGCLQPSSIHTFQQLPPPLFSLTAHASALVTSALAVMLCNGLRCGFAFPVGGLQVADGLARGADRTALPAPPPASSISPARLTTQLSQLIATDQHLPCVSRPVGSLPLSPSALCPPPAVLHSPPHRPFLPLAPVPVSPAWDSLGCGWWETLPCPALPVLDSLHSAMC